MKGIREKSSVRKSYEAPTLRFVPTKGLQTDMLYGSLESYSGVGNGAWLGSFNGDNESYSGVGNGAWLGSFNGDNESYSGPNDETQWFQGLANGNVVENYLIQDGEIGWSTGGNVYGTLNESYSIHDNVVNWSQSEFVGTTNGDGGLRSESYSGVVWGEWNDSD